MAFTEFCCRAGGSNLNAGTRNGSGEPGTAADFTYASGSWVASTGVFTVAAGNPLTDGVAVGDFASVYADGSSVTGFVGRITARTATTITVSLTARIGAAPTDGTGNRTLKVGGAWQGPNGASGFPLSLLNSSAIQNLAGDTPRINFKNDQTYAVTATVTVNNFAGPIAYQGYTATYGDGGFAILDGGTSGAAYQLTSWTLNGAVLRDFHFRNNGGTSTIALAVSIGMSNGALVERCRFSGMRGNAVRATGTMIECEAYGNTGIGFDSVGGAHLRRCVSHDNTGMGFGVTGVHCVGCLAYGNTSHGFGSINNSAVGPILLGCDAYNNGGSGLFINYSSPAGVYVESCSFVKNALYGINLTGSRRVGIIRNCGFGAGTQANTSGQTTGLDAVATENLVTYPADVTPWVNPGSGNFRVNLGDAKGMGRGLFPQATGGPTVGYPDIGAAQHLDAGAIAFFG